LKCQPIKTLSAQYFAFCLRNGVGVVSRNGVAAGSIYEIGDKFQMDFVDRYKNWKGIREMHVKVGNVNLD
jgi:hypothetical protein